MDNTWHLFPIQISSNYDKQKIQLLLRERFQVETEHYYPVLTHKHKTPLQSSIYSRINLPTTEKIHRSLIHLPLHNQFTLNEQDRVLEAIYAVFK